MHLLFREMRNVTDFEMHTEFKTNAIVMVLIGTIVFFYPRANDGDVLTISSFS